MIEIRSTDGRNLLHVVDADTLVGADLAGLKLRQAKLTGADLTGANLQGADLFNAQLHRARLMDANLSGANVSSANLNSATLTGANLAGAQMNYTALRRSFMINCNLERADLEIADLHEASLFNSNLQDAVLQRAAIDSTIFINTGITPAQRHVLRVDGKPSFFEIEDLIRCLESGGPEEGGRSLGVMEHIARRGPVPELRRVAKHLRDKSGFWSPGDPGMKAWYRRVAAIIEESLKDQSQLPIASGSLMVESEGAASQLPRPSSSPERRQRRYK